jgi:hypothetical protein
MELSWYCAGGWNEATKLLGGSMVFQEATCEPTGKARNRQHDMGCLTDTWANRIAMVSSVIIKYLTLASIGWS